MSKNFYPLPPGYLDPDFGICQIMGQAETFTRTSLRTKSECFWSSKLVVGVSIPKDSLV
jgi:hypothetical protein